MEWNLSGVEKEVAASNKNARKKTFETFGKISITLSLILKYS